VWEARVTSSAGSTSECPERKERRALETMRGCDWEDLIHPLQTGYVPERRIHSNILIHDLIHHTSSSHSTLLFDFSKAFDSMDHTFIDHTLLAMNFSPSFRNTVAQMVTNAWSSVIVNGVPHHKQFPVSSGTRQGDPISGFLFILGMKVLAMQIRLDKKIKGVNLSPNNPVKYVIYCDDLTLYLRSPSSLKRALLVLRRFAAVSGMQINLSKSAISPPPETTFSASPPSHQASLPISFPTSTSSTTSLYPSLVPTSLSLAKNQLGLPTVCPSSPTSCLSSNLQKQTLPKSPTTSYPSFSRRPTLSLPASSSPPNQREDLRYCPQPHIPTP